VTQTDRGVYVAAIRAAAGSSTLWGAITAALLDTSVAAVNRTLKELDAAAIEQMMGGLAQMTILRRAPRLAQVAEVAAFLASDRAGAMAGTITNVTCGLVPG
jgi:enoyl-[acyl-carrier-protein] reductase (NADH)